MPSTRESALRKAGRPRQITGPAFPWGKGARSRWGRFARAVVCHIGLFLLCMGLAVASGCTRIAAVPEAGETISNWTLARDYQAQGRYELARQHYLLALAAARTPESQQTLQRELDSVERMLEAMR